MLYGDTTIINDITECDADSVILQADADVIICTKVLVLKLSQANYY